MPLLRKLAVDRVRRRRSRQIMEERGVGHRDMRALRLKALADPARVKIV
jgi:hypothetical protein